MTWAPLAPYHHWLEAIHVIFVIAWMAALLYLPRLYVYHTQAGPGTEGSERFKIMERRLFFGIATPALIAVWLVGILLILTPGAIRWDASWWHVKLASVIALAIFHFVLARWRRAFLLDRNRHSERFYRAINEVPTALMILIVIMIVVRPF